MSDTFTPESLRKTLGTRPFVCFQQVGSTQDVAREWALAASDPAPQGAVVIAEEQTAGRGRQGRTWFSPPGSSVMISVVLRPDLPPEHMARCTMIGGLAVLDVVRPALGERVTLKWPNDVLVGTNKLCGVLPEATWIGDRLAAVILGIGLNVRRTSNSADLPYAATSIEAETGRVVDRHGLLRALLARVDYWAAQVTEALLVETWRANLGTLGKRVDVYTKPGAFPSPSFSGVAESVEDDGALNVRLDSGELRRVLAADVALSEA